MKALSIPRAISIALSLFVSLSASAASINGPDRVCPGQTVTYSLQSPPIGAYEFQWIIFENGVVVTTLLSYGATSSIAFSTSTVQQVIVQCKVYTILQGHIGTYSKTVAKMPPNPPSPNGGLVVMCHSGDFVEASTLPLALNYPNDWPDNYNACHFHCGYIWDVSSPHVLLLKDSLTGPDATSLGYTYPGVDNVIYISTVSPFPSGNIGTLTVKARYPDCTSTLPITQSSSSIWGGTPTIGNATVNGSPATGMNYNVSSPAYLQVNYNGATNWTWTVGSGSGTLNPSGNSCSVSFSSFVRVIAQTSNRCGTGDSHTFYLFAPDYSPYRIAPNPIDKNVQVIFQDEEVPKFLLKEVGIYDKNGKLVRAFDIEKATETDYFNQSKVVELNTSTLSEGTYFLKVVLGDKSETHQLIK